jgi:hypothetical protein
MQLYASVSLNNAGEFFNVFDRVVHVGSEVLKGKHRHNNSLQCGLAVFWA